MNPAPSGIRDSQASKGILFFLCAVLVCTSLGCAVTHRLDGRDSSSERPTEVIRYVPPDMPGDERTGYCWTNSIAVPREDAWRCMVGNEIFDPCFAVGSSMVCETNPALKKQGFRLVLDRPLPPPLPVAAGEASSGWLIQLSDGTLCNRATGARGMVDGQMTTYYCASQERDDATAVLGELNRGAVWTADIAVTDRTTGKIKERKITPVARVWQ